MARINRLVASVLLWRSEAWGEATTMSSSARNVVVVVERSVGVDVDFRAGEHANVVAGGVDGVDRVDVFAQPLDRESVGLGAGTGVVGDGDGVETAFAGGVDEFVDRHVPVRGDGVGVQLGADIAQRDQVGGRAFKFASGLAQLGRNEGKLQSAVDVRFHRGGDRSDAAGLRRLVDVVGGEEPVLVEPHRHADGTFAQQHVVFPSIP